MAAFTTSPCWSVAEQANVSGKNHTLFDYGIDLHSEDSKIRGGCIRPAVDYIDQRSEFDQVASEPYESTCL